MNLNLRNNFSRNNLPKIKDVVNVINLDEYKSIGTHWIALYVNGDNWIASYNVTYCDRFDVEDIAKEIEKFIRNKNITNIYRIQTYDSITCRYFFIGFIDFILKLKCLLDYTNIFSPYEYGKNDQIILK